MKEFEFSENAYFFKLKEEVDMDKIVKQLFQSVDKNREGEVYKEDIRLPVTLINGMSYSFKAFKRKLLPPCFAKDTPPDAKYYDRKFAYLLVVEYKNYVVVLKRYIPTIKVLRDVVISIDYNVLCNMLVGSSTVFKRFSMNNLDMADYAMRGKVVEAEDLEAVFSTIGANNFALNSMRIENDGDDYSLAMNLSKVNQYGKKTDFDNLTRWFKLIIDKLEASRKDGIDGYLSIFATPVDYKREFAEGNLKAKFILVSLYKLFEEKWIDKITQIQKKEGGGEEEIQIDVDKICLLFKTAFDLRDDSSGNYSAAIDGGTGTINIVVRDSGILFASNWCNSITLYSNDADHSNQRLDDYIRGNGLFTVMFDDLRIRYTNRQLFRDNKLTGNIDVFLDLFEDDSALVDITSEKGEPRLYKTSMVDFPDKSLFSYIENKYADPEKIMVCDDLGTEWADYIVIGKDSVALFAAKYKPKSFSASNFQEVIGQVQKNLSVFFPLEAQWKQKENKWKGTYKLNSVKTKINKLRTTGKTSKDAVALWQKAERSLNFKRDVYLIINFISKNDLSKHLENLKKDVDFGEKKETIPLLWLISSLYATCQEMHIGLHITCQP